MTASEAGALEHRIAKACESGRVCAAALAIHADGQTQAFAAGFANAREDILATPDTLFHIGSATKAITAELVWRLIVDGRLTADLPVIEAAPELAHIATLADKRLTIGHLLSHTGGLDGDVIFEAGRGKDVLRRFMSQIQEIGSLCAPGERFSYANVGYNILARIVELHAAAPFEEALGDLLRNTHGLSQFAILPEEKIRQRTALLLTRHGQEWVPSLFGPHSNIGSGTVLAMSMPDLARWGALLAMSGEVASRMRQPAVRLPFNHRYQGWGFGVSLLDGMGAELFGHDGGTAGTATFLRIAPKSASASAWAFAATGPDAVAVYRDIEPLIRETLGIGPAPPRKPQGAPPRDLTPYEGRYERHGMTFDIQAGEGETLLLSASGAMASPILDGLHLRPLTTEVFETTIPALDASIWVSFHDFASDGKPGLLSVLERLARRAQADVT
ncbi:MAG: ampC [Phenylobacterium sp.]|nr:ampC [Phenylobacterium sp.]